MDDLLAWLLRALPVLTAGAGFGLRSLVFRQQRKKEQAEMDKGWAEVQQAKDAHELEVAKFQADTTAEKEAKDREWLNRRSSSATASTPKISSRPRPTWRSW